MNTVYLSLGSNQGDRRAWLRKAIALLEEYGMVSKVSSLYQTAAWGLEDQPDFLNMALCMQTGSSATELLHAIQHVEQQLGRVRNIKWGPRTLDIDILFFNNDVIDLPDLQIPHPFLSQRRFVLAPLAEITAEYVHPVLNKTVDTLLAECTDMQEVTIAGNEE